MAALRINAWLERAEPIISLHSDMSNQLIAQWRGEAVAELLEQGIITCQELFSENPKIQQQVAHELLLTACANTLCAKNSSPCFSCITGRLLQSFMHASPAECESTSHSVIAA